MPNQRVYALTPKDNHVLLETMTVDHKAGGNPEVIDRAVALAAVHGEQIDVHAHNQWWAAIYSAYPDGKVWYHATGSKQGWIR